MPKAEPSGPHVLLPDRQTGPGPSTAESIPPQPQMQTSPTFLKPAQGRTGHTGGCGKEAGGRSQGSRGPATGFCWAALGAGASWSPRRGRQPTASWGGPSGRMSNLGSIPYLEGKMENLGRGHVSLGKVDGPVYSRDA